MGGIRHELWHNLQVEPSGLWHCEDLEQKEYYTFHFTYGLEYRKDGFPVKKVGEWSLDKRHYNGAFPPAKLTMPPPCAGQCAHVLTTMFNEATEALKDQWPKRVGRDTLGWSSGAKQEVAQLPASL